MRYDSFIKYLLTLILIVFILFCQTFSIQIENWNATSFTTFQVDV